MKSLAAMALLVALATPQVGFVRTAGIAYEAGRHGRLDVYAPRKPAPHAPVVVFFYGGGWEWGSRALYRFVGASLARQGVVVVIPDYRVHPEVRFPAFLQDNARAVAWARRHAADYGGDPRRLFLMGHSAGAYNAAMLALDERWLKPVGVDPATDIRGVIGLSGPYDFLPLKSPVLKTIFGPEGGLHLTQPVTHVDGEAPPFLLVAGERDEAVNPRNTRHLAERLRRAGGEVETVMHPGADHSATVTDLLPLVGGRLQVRQAVMGFISARSGPLHGGQPE